MDKQIELYHKAKEEDGVSEFPGEGENPRIIEYHSTTTLKADNQDCPWCSSFVNWVCAQVGVPGTKSAAARSWLKWGVEIEAPQVGDLVIIQRGTSKTSGHVGFFEGFKDDRIIIFGGNQGDRVCSAPYKKSLLLGYRRYQQT